MASGSKCNSALALELCQLTGWLRSQEGGAGEFRLAESNQFSCSQRIGVTLPGSLECATFFYLGQISKVIARGKEENNILNLPPPCSRDQCSGAQPSGAVGWMRGMVLVHRLDPSSVQYVGSVCGYEPAHQPSSVHQIQL